MAVDLNTLFSLAPGTDDALDQFVASCLTDGEVWNHRRASDGIKTLRVIESEPDRVRVCGRIWEIDQTLHGFWLELERDDSGERVTWALYFDVIARTPRRVNDAIDTYDRAEDIEWRVMLAGHAEVRAGVLTVIAGSTHVVGRDDECHLGSVSVHDYLEEVFGYSPRMARERVRVALALADLLELSAGLASGELSYSAVRELTRIATRETEREWCEAARGQNQRQIEQAVSTHKRGTRLSDPP